jgi:hypothetical protein
MVEMFAMTSVAVLAILLVTPFRIFTLPKAHLLRAFLNNNVLWKNRKQSQWKLSTHMLLGLSRNTHSLMVSMIASQLTLAAAHIGWPSDNRKKTSGSLECTIKISLN